MVQNPRKEYASIRQTIRVTMRTLASSYFLRQSKYRSNRIIRFLSSEFCQEANKR